MMVGQQLSVYKYINLRLPKFSFLMSGMKYLSTITIKHLLVSRFSYPKLFELKIILYNNTTHLYIICNLGFLCFMWRMYCVGVSEELS